MAYQRRINYDELQPGDLREVIDIQSYSVVNTKGVKAKTWATDTSNEPALVRFLSGSDRIRVGHTEADSVIDVVMRKGNAVVAQNRIVFESNNYYVTGIPEEVGRRRFIRFQAKRGDADA